MGYRYRVTLTRLSATGEDGDEKGCDRELKVERAERGRKEGEKREGGGSRK